MTPTVDDSSKLPYEVAWIPIHATSSALEDGDVITIERFTLTLRRRPVGSSQHKTGKSVTDGWQLPAVQLDRNTKGGDKMTKKVILYSAIGASVFLMFVALPGGMSYAYGLGFNQGEIAGEESTYHTAKAEGLDQGYERGYQEGYQAGNKSGFAEGKEIGHDEGYNEAKEYCSASCYAQGYRAGYSEGYAEGCQQCHSGYGYPCCPPGSYPGDNMPSQAPNPFERRW